MARQSDLRQRIKGLERRLERAEALLRDVTLTLDEEFGLSDRRDIHALVKKAEQFIIQPIDTCGE